MRSPLARGWTENGPLEALEVATVGAEIARELAEELEDQLGPDAALAAVASERTGTLVR